MTIPPEAQADRAVASIEICQLVGIFQRTGWDDLVGTVAGMDEANLRDLFAHSIGLVSGAMQLLHQRGDLD